MPICKCGPTSPGDQRKSPTPAMDSLHPCKCTASASPGDQKKVSINPVHSYRNLCKCDPSAGKIPTVQSKDSVPRLKGKPSSGDQKRTQTNQASLLRLCKCSSTYPTDDEEEVSASPYRSAITSCKCGSPRGEQKKAGDTVYPCKCGSSRPGTPKKVITKPVPSDISVQETFHLCQCGTSAGDVRKDRAKPVQSKGSVIICKCGTPRIAGTICCNCSVQSKPPDEIPCPAMKKGVTHPQDEKRKKTLAEKLWPFKKEQKTVICTNDSSKFRTGKKQKSSATLKQVPSNVSSKKTPPITCKCGTSSRDKKKGTTKPVQSKGTPRKSGTPSTGSMTHCKCDINSPIQNNTAGDVPCPALKSRVSFRKEVRGTKHSPDRWWRRFNRSPKVVICTNDPYDLYRTEIKQKASVPMKQVPSNASVKKTPPPICKCGTSSGDEKKGTTKPVYSEDSAPVRKPGTPSTGNRLCCKCAARSADQNKLPSNLSHLDTLPPYNASRTFGVTSKHEIPMRCTKLGTTAETESWDSLASGYAVPAASPSSTIKVCVDDQMYDKIAREQAQAQAQATPKMCCKCNPSRYSTKGPQSRFSPRICSGCGKRCGVRKTHSKCSPM